MRSLGYLVSASLLAAAAVADPAQAGVAAFTDRAKWTAAAGAAVHIDFSTRDDRTPVSTLPYAHFPSLTLKGVTFTNVGIHMRPNPGRHAAVIRTGDFASVPDNTPWRIHLPAGTVAFGLDLAPFYNVPGTYTFSLSSGQALASSARVRAPAYDFFGVVSTAPIEWVEISLNTSYLAADNFSFVSVAPVIAIAIDVLPLAKKNALGPDEDEEIPVAILASATFAVTSVHVPTVRLGPTGTEAVSRRSAFRDVDSDGRPDLVLYFRRRDAAPACGTAKVILTGQTTDGKNIQGSDAIHAPPCADTGRAGPKRK
jgi:hypothetical protein